MLHNFCRKVPLNEDDEEEATGNNIDADDTDSCNETEEGRQTRDEFVRSFFFHNFCDSFKLMTSFVYLRYAYKGFIHST